MSTLSVLKIRAAIFVSTLTLALVSTVLPAQMPAPRAKVTVPFAFQAGSTHFAAGTYILSRPEDHLLFVQGGTRSAFVMSSHDLSSTPASVGKVVFHRYGNQYFLREVWMRGDTDHVCCPQSKAEKEAKRSQSDNERASVPDHTNVEIALLVTPR
jgi:hypothetical protein